MKALRRPILEEPGYTCILSPRCFYWARGRLYVGHNRLSKLHPSDEPVWDPVPVKPFTVIEAMGGFFQLTHVQSEKGPYYRKWARLESHFVIQPSDFGDGFLKKEIDQGSIEVHNAFTLEPNTMLRFEHEWNRDMIARWADPDKLVPKIERQPRLTRERAYNGRARKDIENWYPQARANRERLILQYARLRGSNSHQ
jgi:hypothetical protein